MMTAISKHSWLVWLSSSPSSVPKPISTADSCYRPLESCSSSTGCLKSGGWSLPPSSSGDTPTKAYARIELTLICGPGSFLVSSWPSWGSSSTASGPKNATTSTPTIPDTSTAPIKFWPLFQPSAICIAPPDFIPSIIHWKCAYDSKLKCR